MIHSGGLRGKVGLEGRLGGSACEKFENKDRQIYRQTERQSDRETDSQTNRQTDRQTVRQMDRTALAHTVFAWCHIRNKHFAILS